jgi:hypothetical protein
LDVDDQPRLQQLSPQAIVLACERSRSMGLGDRRVGLASPPARIEPGLALSGTTLAPRRQVGRIDAFAPQQCADLTRLATPVSLGQDASFLAGRELPASGDRHHLRLRWSRAGSRVCARPTGSLQRGFPLSGLG